MLSVIILQLTVGQTHEKTSERLLDPGINQSPASMFCCTNYWIHADVVTEISHKVPIGILVFVVAASVALLAGGIVKELDV